VAEHVGGDAVADGGAFAVEADQAADHLGGGGGAAGVNQERLGGRGAEIAGGAVIAQEGLDLIGDEDAALAVALPIYVWMARDRKVREPDAPNEAVAANS